METTTFISMSICSRCWLSACSQQTSRWLQRQSDTFFYLATTYKHWCNYQCSLQSTR